MALATAALLAAAAATVLASPPLPSDGSVWDAFRATGKAGGGGATVPGVTAVSYWGPGLLRTSSNRTLLFVEADRSASSHDGFIEYAVSTDDGRSFGQPTRVPGHGRMYSKTTNTIFMLAGPPSGPPLPSTVRRLYGGKCEPAGHPGGKWSYDATSGWITAAWAGAPSLDTALGLESCANATRCSPSSVSFGMARNGSEACGSHAAAAYGWDFKSGQIVHRLSGQCLTVPARKSALLTKCVHNGEGQMFVRGKGSPFQITEAKGMGDAGRCLAQAPAPPPPLPAAAARRQRLDRDAALASYHTTPCETEMMAKCNATRLRDPEHGYPRCEACMEANAAAFVTAGCAKADGSLKNANPATFCGGCTKDGGCGLTTASASGLFQGPQPCGTETGIIKSTDEGRTWGEWAPIVVNGSSWTSHAGGGLAHGIEMEQEGRYKGRLLMSRHFDCSPNDDPPQTQRDFILYSDDQGKTWARGQLLPTGWTESQVAELKNGSLLLTTRTAYAYLTADPPLRRAFARSDNGGETWAQTWLLEDRQPEVYAGSCENTLVSDPQTGIVYYSLPSAANFSRSNYSVYSSANGGADWELVKVVNPAGSGYSDSWLIPAASPSEKAKLMVAFQRCLYEANAEGGAYNMGFSIVDVSSPAIGLL